LKQGIKTLISGQYISRKYFVYIVELGNLLLFFSVACYILHFISTNKKADVKLASIGCAMLVASFIALVYAFISSDFSVASVVNYSHSNKPLIYKISAAWGNHEGSMLLWLVVLAIFHLGLCLITRNNLAIRIHAVIIGLFWVYVVFLSSPYLRLDPPALEGQGLNPILQDPLLVIHPPMLYLGYVGSATLAALAMAYALRFKPEQDMEVYFAYFKLVRPIALLLWLLLSAGVALGMYWAYRELGWGGFWFWDPVENASLIPWLFLSALLHIKREHYLLWLIVLPLPFLTSVLGTFMVRSGLLDSVHSFASDPNRGVFILIILIGYALLYTSLLLLKWRQFSSYATTLDNGKGQSFNNILLFSQSTMNITMAVITLVGSYLPVIWLIYLEKTAATPSLGAGYFYHAVAPLMVGLFAGFGLWMRLKHWQWLLAGLITIVCGIYYEVLNEALWYIFCSIIAGISIINLFKRCKLGLALIHIGAAISLIAIVMAVFFEQVRVINVLEGANNTHQLMLNHKVKLLAIEHSATKQYLQITLNMQLSDNNGDSDSHETIAPALRFYPVGDKLTQEVYVKSGFYGDLYFSIAQGAEFDLSKKSWLVRVQYKPAMWGLWLGIIITIIGGSLRLKRKFTLLTSS
jgi:cytochrome c-type biogenesis protein CcmF